MSDSKKPDESKKSTAMAEEKKDELSADELEAVAGGVLNLGNIATIKQTPVLKISIDPNIPPVGGTSE